MGNMDNDGGMSDRAAVMMTLLVGLILIAGIVFFILINN